MLLSGVMFAFLRQWLLAALLWAGAFGCIVAALHFKDHTITGGEGL